MLPPKLKKPRKQPKARKPGQPYKSPAHLRFVRQHQCSAQTELCVGLIHAHHVKTRGAGGGDEWCVSLCAYHHNILHTVGRDTFGERYSIDLTEMARAFARASPDPEIRRRAEHVR